MEIGAESVPWQNGKNRRPACAFGRFWLSKITIFDGLSTPDRRRRPKEENQVFNVLLKYKGGYRM